MNSDGGEYWIYHERQVSHLCGQHALNNLVQANVFQTEFLAQIAHELDAMELNFMSQNNEGGTRSREYLSRVAEGSANVDPSGNFSIEVLRAALFNRYQLELPNVNAEGVSDNGDVTKFEGFICNKDAHWFAIRKINGRYWNLNSMKEQPETISHFKLATEIAGFQNSGYTVFCVPLGLPPACKTESQRGRGLPEYWWKEDDLVKGKGKDATTAATWSNVGSGMRLDGRSTTSNQNLTDGLTEDEMLEMALKASLESISAPKPEATVTLTDEPPQGTPDTARIQFRLQNGTRIRRFLKSDLVSMVYAYVESESTDAQGRLVELRAGYPPEDLQKMKQKTIGEANLSGKSIQCRFA